MQRAAASVGAIGLAVAAVWAALWLSLPAEQPGPCTVSVPPTPMPGLMETSGLAVSRRHRGVLWSHNDSGNGTVLFALDRSGRILGRVRVPIRTRDWEDVSAAACPGGDCLYIADIGDNGLSRPVIDIYRVSEPSPTDAETRQPDVFHATYADGPHNAEAMFVVGASVFIVTRDRTGGLYRAALPAGDRGDLVFQRIGELGLSAVTDAEAFDDGRSVVVRTSHDAVIYRANELIRGGVIPEFRIRLDGLREPQGEGVAIDGNRLFLSSEGRRWNRGGWFMSLSCAFPSTGREGTPPGLPSPRP